MFKSIDWQFLFRPLLIFSILLISSIVFYIAGDQYRDAAKQNFDDSKRKLSSSHRQLNKQSQKIALLDQYFDQYKQLVNNGFIGKERRLSWVESLEKTNKEIQLPSFSYVIKPQGAFIRPGIKKSKTVKALSSSMTLSLGLLHEEDLFKVFESLEEKVKSRFVIDSCDLFLKSKALTTDQKNISTQCVVRWINISVASKK